MSMEGLQVLRNYFTSQDSSVFEPLFIAQYLLVPVNTIVKYSFLPWMKKGIEGSTNKLHNKATSEKLRTNFAKSENFLQYELLKNLMNIVSIHGRDKSYKFEADEKLKKIKEGSYGDQLAGDKTKNIIAFDSFMTIWLLTLPEKFQDWWQFHKTENNIPRQSYILLYHEVPAFPSIAPNTQSCLQKNPSKNSYDILPNSWDLRKCYIYFFDQKELWTTKSIEREYESIMKASNPLFFASKLIEQKQKQVTDNGEQEIDHNGNGEDVQVQVSKDEKSKAEIVEIDDPSDVEQTDVTDQEDLENMLEELMETNKIVPQVEEKESIEYQLEPNNNILEFEEKNNEGKNPETTKKDDVIPRKKRVPD